MTTPKPTPPEVMWRLINWDMCMRRWTMPATFNAGRESVQALANHDIWSTPTFLAAVIPAERYDELVAKERRLALLETGEIAS
jgi:hypothetical protein